MKTKYKIIEYIKINTEVSAKQLVDYLELSERAVFKQLAKLIEAGELTKIGTPPKVFYKIKKATDQKTPLNLQVKADIRKLIEDNYVYITPLGEYHKGVLGFVSWCRERSLIPDVQANQYAELINKIDKSRKHGVIVATNKFKDSFDKPAIKQVYYADFYSLPQFGKTKLGQLLLYAKQSQDKKRIKNIADIVRSSIDTVIKIYQIEAVGFIPPTVKREIQFMKELERNLAINLPIISLSKIKTEIIVPQKTLSKMSDRIANAQNTIIVEDIREYKNVLLIDDAAGSGATLNETAKKLVDKKLAKNVYGMVVVGSYKGFDVISEV